MSRIVSISDFLDSAWSEAFSSQNDGASLHVFQNSRTGELEIVQVNDQGEANRIVLDHESSALLRASLASLGR